MAGCVLRTLLTTAPSFGEWSPSRDGHFNCVVSDAEELSVQVVDAVEFLTANRDQLASPGFVGAILDFGVWQRDALAIYSRFPANLVQAAGSLGFGIELSQYCESDE